MLLGGIVFIIGGHTPIVHSPQHGKELVTCYLEAALHAFFNPTFHVIRKLFGEQEAMLEFESDIDGVSVNAVDIVKWNAAGQVVDFKGWSGH